MASVSATSRSRCVTVASKTSGAPWMVRLIRSLTCRPASRRACWMARTRSRATPSVASSGVTCVSRTMNPPPGSIAVAAAVAGAREPAASPGCWPSPATTVSRVYSPASSSSPPEVTTPSAETDQSPVLLPRMAVWTSLPSRGPAARALTVSRWVTPKSASLAVSTSTKVIVLTLSSSRMIEANGSSFAGSGATTVRPLSGSRARSPLALRRLDPTEHTSRARSMARTSSWSAGSSPASG